MSEYTPGPWFMRVNRHRDTNGSKWGWVDSNDSGSQRPPAGVSVCWTEGKTSHANARLIAKAPEMLGALEYLRTRLDDIEDIRFTDKVIKEAKGKQE